MGFKAQQGTIITIQKWNELQLNSTVIIIQIQDLKNNVKSISIFEQKI